MFGNISYVCFALFVLSWFLIWGFAHLQVAFTPVPLRSYAFIWVLLRCSTFIHVSKCNSVLAKF